MVVWSIVFDRLVVMLGGFFLLFWFVGECFCRFLFFGLFFFVFWLVWLCFVVWGDFCVLFVWMWLYGVCSWFDGYCGV